MDGRRFRYGSSPDVEGGPCAVSIALGAVDHHMRGYRAFPRWSLRFLPRR